MYELTGRLLQDVSFSARGQVRMTFEFNEKISALQMFNELKEAGKVAIKVGKYRERRSLDANAYCWVLIGKIAEKTNISTSEVYRAAIKEIGGNSDTVCVQNGAVASLCAGWARNGIGWQTETFPSKLDGCTNVILYYGSSTYDSAQMSRLINMIVQECEQLGIETKSPAEVASLLDSWGGG